MSHGALEVFIDRMIGESGDAITLAGMPAFHDDAVIRDIVSAAARAPHTLRSLLAIVADMPTGARGRERHALTAELDAALAGAG